MSTNSRILPNFLKQPGLLFFMFCFCFIFWLIDLWRPINLNMDQSNFVWDMFGYYSYLPAILQNHGSFQFDETVFSFAYVCPNGVPISKYTYGVALLQLPFFLLAWLISLITGYSGNSFSSYYVICIEMGTLFYVLLGLYLLRKVLLNFYSDFVVALTLSVTLFGTMLFMYTFVQAEMSHAYLFFLFCVFLYFTHAYYVQETWRRFIALAVVGGLIVLIRPVEIYVFAFFILWQVKTLQQLKTRLKEFFSDWRKLSVMMGIGLLFWLPQFIFWKTYTGHFYFDTYKGEHFFWSDPQIFNVLLSYRKGWITYTPGIVLCFIGFFMVGKKSPISGWTFFGITALTVYVFSCWWTWDYGGCFGAREFCQQIAYLSFPLAALIDRVTSSDSYFLFKRVCAIVVFFIAFSAIVHNIGESYQYQKQRKLHPNSMSKELYWSLFRTYQYNKYFEDVQYNQQLNINRTEDWMKGINRADKNDK